MGPTLLAKSPGEQPRTRANIGDRIASFHAGRRQNFVALDEWLAAFRFKAPNTFVDARVLEIVVDAGSDTFILGKRHGASGKCQKTSAIRSEHVGHSIAGPVWTVARATIHTIHMSYIPIIEAGFAGIEAGGTKFVCGVGSGPGDLHKIEFPTTTPAETLGKAIQFFRGQAEVRPVKALGVACFGPVDLSVNSPTYGHITSTPKAGWRDFDIVGNLAGALGVPVAFDTDVNAAILAEVRWGAARGLSDAIYITVGTGIGGGAFVAGELLHGSMHPEMGHLLIAHDRLRDPFEGCCPFHGNCFEGLASGPSMEKRWGRRAEELPAGHPAWDLEAHYLAVGLMNLVLTLSPKRVIMGGGVLRSGRVLPLVRSELRRLLNGYLQSHGELKDGDRFVVSPFLGDSAGVLGALALAEALGEN